MDRKKIYIYPHRGTEIWWVVDDDRPLNKFLRPDGDWWNSGPYGSIAKSRRDGTLTKYFFNSKRWAIAEAKRRFRGCQILFRRHIDY